MNCAKCRIAAMWPRGGQTAIAQKDGELGRGSRGTPEEIAGRAERRRQGMLKTKRWHGGRWDKRVRADHIRRRGLKRPPALGAARAGEENGSDRPSALGFGA